MSINLKIHVSARKSVHVHVFHWVKLQCIYDWTLIGDIQELYQIKLQPGHAAAFASDCDLPETHDMVRSVSMQVNTLYCLHVLPTKCKNWTLTNLKTLIKTLFFKL